MSELTHGKNFGYPVQARDRRSGSSVSDRGLERTNLRRAWADAIDPRRFLHPGSGRRRRRAHRGGDLRQSSVLTSIRWTGKSDPHLRRSPPHRESRSDLPDHPGSPTPPFRVNPPLTQGYPSYRKFTWARAAPSEPARAPPNNRTPIRAVCFAAVILAPSSFVRILTEKTAADPVMLADLGAAKPREVRLGLIDVGAAFPAHVIGRVQPLPCVRLVGMDDRARCDAAGLRRADSFRARPHKPDSWGDSGSWFGIAPNEAKGLATALAFMPGYHSSGFHHENGADVVRNTTIPRSPRITSG